MLASGLGGTSRLTNVISNLFLVWVPGLFLTLEMPKTEGFFLIHILEKSETKGSPG